MKVFIVFILATVILQSNGSMEDFQIRENLLSAPKGMTRQSLWQQLNTVVRDSLQGYQIEATRKSLPQIEATEEDRQAVDAVLPHGDTSLIQTFEESSTTSATTPENASKAKPGKKKRTEEDSDSEEETGPDAKRKPLSGEIHISSEMKTTLRELAEAQGGKITLAAAREKLINLYPSLAEDLQNWKSKLYQTLISYLSNGKLLRTVRTPKEKITEDIKTTLRELAQEHGGKITLAAARKKLIELDPSLAEDLQKSRSRISHNVGHYLTRHNLLESVRIREERFTEGMKTALTELSQQYGGKITLDAARKKLLEMDPSLGPDLKDSRSKIYDALRRYLTDRELLKIVNTSEERITEGMKKALRELAEAHGGRITLDEARKKLLEMDPSLGPDLKNWRSRISDALRHYLSHHKLLETVRSPEERFTDEMKTSLAELAEAQGGKITLATAREELIDLDPSLDQDLKDSRSKLSYALRRYLTDRELLQTVQTQEERFTDEMKTALAELAEAHGGKIPIAKAREKVTDLDPSLSPDLKDPKSKLSYALRRYLTDRGLLQTVLSSEERFTDEMKTSLAELAEAQGGKITLDEAREELIDLDPSLDQDLKDSRSKLYKALIKYLSHHKILETVRAPEERITEDMKTGLAELAQKHGGKIPIAKAREELIKLYPSLDQDLKDSRSKLSYALRRYLTDRELLQTVQTQEERITDQMKTALAELAKAHGGKITLDEAREELIDLDPSLDQDLQDAKSKLYKALIRYLRDHELLQTVTAPEERITEDMKTALAELAEAHGGKITLDEAREELIDLDPSLGQDLKDSRSKFYKALIRYLSHHKILKTTPKASEKL